MSILITGGTGYIGSHAAVLLLQQGYNVVMADNLSHSDAVVHSRIKHITLREVRLYAYDLCGVDNIRDIFERERISAVLHMAWSQAESAAATSPADISHPSLNATKNLLTVMKEFGVNKLVLNSTSAVYGAAAALPLAEDAPTRPVHPYGRSALLREQILRELFARDAEWGIVLLRGFNPAGAHESGRLGVGSRHEPDGLLARIAQVAEGRVRRLNVFGGDYPTPDGTAIRDYTHIMDLAAAYVAALKRIEHDKGLSVYNLGRGQGYSVLEVIKTFERVNQVAVPFILNARRPGDIAACWANPAKARWELKWRATRTLEDICRDTWHYQCTTAY